MAKLDTLKLYCMSLGIEEGKDILPTKVRVNKEGETYAKWQFQYDENGNNITKPGRHLEFSIGDYEGAIQKYFLEKYRKEGTLSPFIETILNMKSPMLALQIKHLKPEVQEQVRTDNSDYIYEEKLDGNRCLVCYDENYRMGFL